MSELTQDLPTMTRYLMGSLTGPEAERLDELSVTDEAFAEALSVAERDLIDASAQGELEGSALDQFRSYYLASALRREKVKFAEAFQVFTQKSRAVAPGEIDSSSREVKQKRAGWSSLLSVFAPRLSWQWGQWGLAATAVILLFAGAWLVFQNVRLRQHASEAQARRDELLLRERALQKEVDSQRTANSAAEQELARLRSERGRLEQELEKAKSGRAITPPAEGPIVSFVLVPPVRGAGEMHAVAVPSRTSLVEVQLQLGEADYSAYRVALIDPVSKQALWQSGNLKPRTKNDRKAIGVRFSAALLKPQNYVLQVTGTTAGGGSEIVSDYAFRVSR